jgi:hypothetical protein
MRTNTATQRQVVSWALALGAAAALSLLGVWVRAQDDEPAEPSAHAVMAPLPEGEGSVLPAHPDRDAVPDLASLEATLATLRRDMNATRDAGDSADVRDAGAAGGPALEHAALALARARAAEREGAADAAASLSARRIAYAALFLAEAQRGRERARVDRDAAARERAQAEGALRLADAALALAQENAASAGVSPEPSPDPADGDNNNNDDDAGTP